MTLPFRCALIALNFWMNCPGFTPCWPSAGPIGGAGVAVPPGAWSLNCTVISFFAMIFSRFASRLLDDLHFDIRPRRSRRLDHFGVHKIGDAACSTSHRRLIRGHGSRTANHTQQPVRGHRQEAKGEATNKECED